MTGEVNEVLFRSLTPSVLGILVRRGADFAAAEDAVQDALVEALRVWPADPPRDPKGWLVTVAWRKFVDGQALAPQGAWVRYDGEGRPPVTDGPFAETKDLIAGWMAIDVDSYERAVELAGELSAAPGAGGEPIHEWLEVRPFLTEAPTVTE